MNDLLKINYDREQPTVSARELHKELEVKYDFKRWVDSNFKDFIENTDYFASHMDVNSNQYGGKKEVIDYDLTIDMGKHLSLMSHTSKGMVCRQYLIDLDKAWNTPEQVMARALKMADQTINKLKTENTRLSEAVNIKNQLIGELKPKANFFDAVADSKDAIEMGQVAKVLDYPGVGRNKLFEILRDNGVLRENNEPYQKYIDNGCFRTIEQKYSLPDGSTRINIKTLVYQKGVDYIRKILQEN